MANESVSLGAHLHGLVRGKWRLLVVIGGLLAWFIWIASRTGMGTWVAIWNITLFLGALLILTFPTRTVTVLELSAPFSLGGAMISVALLAGWGLDLVLGTKETAARALGMPLVEETLKIAPVVWILWRQRKRRTLTFGLTDLVLLGAASGAGFYWVEEAYIIHNHNSWSFVGWFPTIDLVGDRHGIHLIAGHAIWTAIAALTIGTALQLRGTRLRMLAGASGWAWSALDHAANNYGGNYRDALASVLRFITADGHLSLYIFLLGVACASGLDIYFLYFARTKTKLPPFPASWSEAKTTWRYLLASRRLAYLGARYQHACSLARVRLALLAIGLGTTLRSRYPRQARVKPAVA